MATKLEISELDFDGIKANLKTFLSQQNEFTDYNFEGSGMSVLMDVLAYNTHYNALYNNMTINEMFLDSASKRNSVVSLSKMLGYVPRSAICSKATISLTLTTPTVSAITAGTATVTTTISNNGGSDVTAVRFRLYQNSVLVSNIAITSFNLGISVQFTGLTPSTQYTVDAVATNSTGNGTSQVASFTTLGNSSIETPTISNLTQTGATLSSTFTNSSGDIYTRYGLLFKLGNSTNLVDGAAGVVRVDTGVLAPNISPAALISQLSGLTANTQYYAKAYAQKDDGLTFLYSAAVSVNTAGIATGTNLAQLGLTTIALSGSNESAESYRFITNSAANSNRSYISTFDPSSEDPTPGVYQLTTTLQQVNLTTLTWAVERKLSPSDTIWKPFAIVNGTTDLASIQAPEMWTYYQYATDLCSNLWALAVRGTTGEKYNVGSDAGVTIKALAEADPSGHKSAESPNKVKPARSAVRREAVFVSAMVACNV